MFNKIKSYFLLFLSLSLVVPLYSFSGGDGSSGSPFEVASCVELQNISSDLSAHYELINSFDCSGILNFETIGSCSGSCGASDLKFNGSFNGNFHTISNINIFNSTTTDSGWGLFGFVDKGNITNLNINGISVNVPNANEVGGLAGKIEYTLIKNISLNNINIIGHYNVAGAFGEVYHNNYNDDMDNISVSGIVQGEINTAGVIGNIDGSMIKNVRFSGDVTGTSSVGGVSSNLGDGGIRNSSSSGTVTGIAGVGGLVGTIVSYGDINSSFSTSNVFGDSEIGGLVGYAYGGNIFNSYATGDVTGENQTGGLVGKAFYAEIQNSYASGDVVGDNEIGGLVGFTRSSSDEWFFVVVNNSYSLGDVTGTNLTSTGGLIGYNEVFAPGDSNILNSYWLNSSGNPSVGIGLDEDSQSIFNNNNLNYFYNNSNSPMSDWDINVWDFYNNSLPHLDSEKYVESITPSSPSSASVNSLPSFGISSVFIVFGLIGLFLI